MIFSETCIQNPVALVLNAPVLTNRFLKEGGFGFFATQIVATFSLPFLAAGDHGGVTFYHNQGFKIRSTLADFRGQ